MLAKVIDFVLINDLAKDFQNKGRSQMTTLLVVNRGLNPPAVRAACAAAAANPFLKLDQQGLAMDRCGFAQAHGRWVLAWRLYAHMSRITGSLHSRRGERGLRDSRKSSE